MEAVEGIVGGFPEFRQLESGLIAQIANVSRIIEVAKEAVLCRQGARPEVLHYLLDGQVALTQAAADGTSTVIDVVEPVHSVALASVITCQPQVMTARTLRNSRLLAIQGEPLRALIATRPSLAVTMLQGLSLDFQSVTRQVLNLKLRSSAQRLGGYLLSLVTDPDARQAEFRLPFPKRLLAARIGCRFEHLSRAFAALRELDVETHGGRVLLHDIPRLRAFASPLPPADLVAPAPSPTEAFSQAFEL
jgi:CRP/FNR family transcriptional activator FtrB